MKKLNLSTVSAILVVFLCISCTEEEEQVYDIDWPLPDITGISPEQQVVGELLTINGNDFTEITRIWVGGVEVAEEDIISSTETEIVVRVPRTAERGSVEVQNIYDKSDVSESIFEPIYPAASVTQWPSEIQRGNPFVLLGENMDMITEVQVGGSVISINGATESPTSVSVQTSDVDLPEDVADITLIAAKGGFEGDITVTDVPVID